MARVFVSYTSADLAVAREVHGWLDEAGHEVFLDQDPRDGVAVGELWRQRLFERLRWADAVVCVVTSASVASRGAPPRSRPHCCGAAGCCRCAPSRTSPTRC